VDESCLSSPIRSGLCGIIRNTFGQYLAGFLGFIQGSSDILLAELYVIYNGLLLARDMDIDELVCYSILYSVSISSNIPKLNIISMLC
jgi:hypothetical protein